MQSGILQNTAQSLLDEIIDGIKSPQKYLPSKLFYDEKGSKLFDQICELEEYYITRTEISIIEENIPISDLRDKILNIDNIESVIFDGIITQRLLDIASSRGVQNIVGARQHDITKIPLNIKIYTFSD